MTSMDAEDLCPLVMLKPVAKAVNNFCSDLPKEDQINTD